MDQILALKIAKYNKREPQYPSYVDANDFGLCLRAAHDLEPGTIVATADFEKTDKIFIANSPREEDRYIAVMDVTPDGKPVNGKIRGKWAFCNHSCDPNCTISDTWSIITNRTVKQGDELTTAYDAYVDNCPWQQSWSFECKCNAAGCKKFIDRYRYDIVYPVKKRM